MAVDARIRELSHRHSALEAELADELKRPMTDPSRLSEIKKHKLRIKDEMLHLETAV